MKILFLGKNFDRGLDASDKSTLLNAAISLGFDVETEHGCLADVAICVDFDASQLRTMRSLRNRGVPLILIKQEPPVILPSHKAENPRGLFSRVYARGVSKLGTGLKYPNSWDMPIEKWDLSAATRLNRFIAISANKWSAIHGELYSLRKELYTSHADVDLFGRGWEYSTQGQLLLLAKETLIAIRHLQVPKIPNVRLQLSRPRNFLGSLDQKTLTMMKYDYSLVIENFVGYMSEKLLDSLLAGNLPVYVGPNCEDFGIPGKFVLQAEPNSRDVRRKMEIARTVDLASHREELWDWLSKPGTKAGWTSKSLNESLLRRIVADFG